MTTIKEARRKLGLTQKQMAFLIGCSQHRVSEIENSIGGRSETRQMRNHIIAIETIADFCLLDTLFEKIDEG